MRDVKTPYLDTPDDHAIDDALDDFRARIWATRGPAYLMVVRHSDERCLSALVSRRVLRETMRRSKEKRSHLKRLLKLRAATLRRRALLERDTVTVVYLEATRMGVAVLEKERPACDGGGAS